jgi:hypothetical protein
MTKELLEKSESEELKAGPEVNADRTKYMRAMWNLPNIRQDFNVDGQVLEEVRVFKYLGS